MTLRNADSPKHGESQQNTKKVISDSNISTTNMTTDAQPLIDQSTSSLHSAPLHTHTPPSSTRPLSNSSSPSSHLKSSSHHPTVQFEVPTRDDESDGFHTPPMNSVAGIGAMSTLEEEHKRQRLSETPVKSTHFTDRVIRENDLNSTDETSPIESYSAHFLRGLTEKKDKGADQMDDGEDDDYISPHHNETRHSQTETDFQQGELGCDIYASELMWKTQMTIQSIWEQLERKTNITKENQYKRSIPIPSKERQSTTSKKQERQTNDMRASVDSQNYQALDRISEKMSINQLALFLTHLCTRSTLTEQIDDVLGYSASQGINLTIHQPNQSIKTPSTSNELQRTTPQNTNAKRIHEQTELNSSPFSHLLPQMKYGETDSLDTEHEEELHDQIPTGPAFDYEQSASYVDPFPPAKEGEIDQDLHIDSSSHSEDTEDDDDGEDFEKSSIGDDAIRKTLQLVLKEGEKAMAKEVDGEEEG